MCTESCTGRAGRSILFSRPMVLALLAGAKTQTRRALRPSANAARNRFGLPGGRLWVREAYFAFGRWETRFNAGKGRDEWYFVDMTLASGKAYGYESDDGHGADPHARRGGGAGLAQAQCVVHATGGEPHRA